MQEDREDKEHQESEDRQELRDLEEIRSKDPKGNPVLEARRAPEAMLVHAGREETSET